ncbi:MAG TPA: hypothetical protein VF056_00960 [Thermoleophilaceae bacterium]
MVAVLGEYLTGYFMWMYEAQLAGGRPLHAYKHIDTRRYVFLDPACNAFAYLGADCYGHVALADALEGALSPLWERLNASTEDIAACWTAIAHARSAANKERRWP